MIKNAKYNQVVHKECRREYSKEWHKKYRRDNPKKVKDYNKMRYHRDIEKIREEQKHWRDLIRYGGNRNAVLERDNWMCVDCGMTQEQHIILFGRSLTIDHIDKKGINYVNKNNDMDNLQTLCLRCHRKKDVVLIMAEKYGELIEQDDSEWRFPRIRELVIKELDSVGTLHKAKGVVAKNLKLSFHAIDQKYCERKVPNSSDLRTSIFQKF